MAKASRITPEFTPAMLTRFWSRVQSGAADECWPWTRATNGMYGLFNVGRRKFLAHRLAYALELSEPTLTREPPVVMHVCDNPLCCNPRHLRPGTMADNQGDMAKKRRSALGQRHGGAKLSWPQVSTIRALLAEGVTAYRLAKWFCVTSGTILDIRNGKNWNRANCADVIPGAPRPSLHH